MRNDPDALMIFAAGFGTRMAPLTDAMPKPLLKVGDKTLLDHAIDIGAEADIETIVVNTHYRSEMIAAHLAGRNVTLSPETPDILDTGGGLLHAGKVLGSQIVFTLNSDAVWLGPNPLDVLRAAWAGADAMGLLLLLPLQGAHNRAAPGDFRIDAQGLISRDGPLVYTGAQIINTARLATIGQGAFSLNAYWDLLMRDGALKGVLYPGEWCDVGTPDGLHHANTLISGQP